MSRDYRLFLDDIQNACAKVLSYTRGLTFAQFVRYVPTTALAKSAQFDRDMMHVALADRRIISVPIRWFPLKLEAASACLGPNYTFDG
jgi:hypothetical protein